MNYISIDGDKMHISISHETITLNKNASFRLSDGFLKSEDVAIRCSAKQFSKIVKAYHKHYTKSRSPHFIWASCVAACVFFAALSLLTIGSNPPPSSIASDTQTKQPSGTIEPAQNIAEVDGNDFPFPSQ
ncbi:hypothetical protein [Neptunomonas phycophila]|uniref:hypothetical protein n=1 Tax=Neptunomonas phycophila TaxID=1572645 RepID=UPI003514BB24